MTTSSHYHSHVDDPAAAGRRLKEARLAAGLSQRRLAFPGCSAAYISRLEAGQRVASLQLLRKIAAKLGADEEFLATGVAREHPRPAELVEADVALRLDDLDTARDLYERALKTSADARARAEALAGLGRLALLQGDPGQAVDSIEEALGLAPAIATTSPGLVLTLGRAYAENGELESAMNKLNDETRITATLAERDRLAGEIHDSVQQGLSGAIIQLDTTLKLPSVTETLRERLGVVRNMVSYARQEVQHVVWDKDSPLLESNDLGEALRQLTTFTASSECVPLVTVTGSPTLLPRVTTHHLLRIAQEATNNALRHATARRIDLVLEYLAGAVSLTVSDDGIGFRASEVLNQPGHFGLRGIRARAKKLNGELTVRSAPGAGATVRHSLN